MLILAGVSISSVLNVGTVDITKEVAFKSEAKDIKDAWETKIIGVDSTFLEYADVSDILSGLNANQSLLDKLEIQNGDLVYKDEMCTQEEKEWFEAIGIFGGVNIVADVKTKVRVLEEWVTVTKMQALDIVIVMDLSGSMRFGYNSGKADLTSADKGIRRGQIMVESINSTVQKIMEKNKENRISIVSFADSSKINVNIPLNQYTYVNPSNRNLFTYTYDNKVNIRSNNIIKSKNGPITGVHMTAVSGGQTYIQGAVYKAYDELNKNRAGYEQNLPVIMLFTDGAPWYQVYKGAFGPKIISNASNTAADEEPDVRGTYVMRTITEIKKKLESSRFYAVNIANYPNKVDEYYARLLLDPTDANINRAKNISTNSPEGAAEINYMTASSLRKWANSVQSDISSGKITKNYTNGYSLGFTSQEALEAIFDNFITDIEQNLEKEYTVTENKDGMVGVFNIDSDNLTYTTSIGPNGKTEDGTTEPKKYYFMLAEDDKVKITVTAAEYKPSTAEGQKAEMVYDSEKTIEREISIQEIKDGVDPNLYYIDGTIKWNVRGEYKDPDSIARQALDQVETTGNNVAQLKEIIIELPVRTERTEIIK